MRRENTYETLSRTEKWAADVVHGVFCLQKLRCARFALIKRRSSGRESVAKCPFSFAGVCGGGGGSGLGDGNDLSKVAMKNCNGAQIPETKNCLSPPPPPSDSLEESPSPSQERLTALENSRDGIGRAMQSFESLSPTADTSREDIDGLQSDLRRLADSLDDMQLAIESGNFSVFYGNLQSVVDTLRSLASRVGNFEKEVIREVVEVAVEVEKVVEVPVFVDRIVEVEKPVNITVEVIRIVEVTVEVDKIIEVEKVVKVTIEVDKIVEAVRVVKVTIEVETIVEMEVEKVVEMSTIVDGLSTIEEVTVIAVENLTTFVPDVNRTVQLTSAPPPDTSVKLCADGTTIPGGDTCPPVVVEDTTPTVLTEGRKRLDIVPLKLLAYRFDFWIAKGGGGRTDADEFPSSSPYRKYVGVVIDYDTEKFYLGKDEYPVSVANTITACAVCTKISHVYVNTESDYEKFGVWQVALSSYDKRGAFYYATPLPGDYKLPTTGSAAYRGGAIVLDAIAKKHYHGTSEIEATFTAQSVDRMGSLRFTGGVNNGDFSIDFENLSGRCVGACPDSIDSNFRFKHRFSGGGVGPPQKAGGIFWNWNLDQDLSSHLTPSEGTPLEGTAALGAFGAVIQKINGITVNFAEIETADETASIGALACGRKCPSTLQQHELGEGRYKRSVRRYAAGGGGNWVDFKIYNAASTVTFPGAAGRPGEIDDRSKHFKRENCLDEYHSRFRPCPTRYRGTRKAIVYMDLGSSREHLDFGVWYSDIRPQERGAYLVGYAALERYYRFPPSGTATYEGHGAVITSSGSYFTDSFFTATFGAETKISGILTENTYKEGSSRHSDGGGTPLFDLVLGESTYNHGSGKFTGGAVTCGAVGRCGGTLTDNTWEGAFFRSGSGSELGTPPRRFGGIFKAKGLSLDETPASDVYGAFGARLQEQPE